MTQKSLEKTSTLSFEPPSASSFQCPARRYGVSISVQELPIPITRLLEPQAGVRQLSLPVPGFSSATGTMQMSPPWMSVSA